MSYLIALLLPPLHFARKKRWGAFTFNLILYLLAFPSLFLFGLGFFFWFICAVLAIWDLRKEVMEEHATMIAEKMAEKMKGKEAR